MPPVRWKPATVAALILVQLALHTNAQIRQDGWRPIIGNRKPSFYETFTPDSSDIYKYDGFSTIAPSTLLPTVTISPSIRPHFRNSPKPSQNPGRKIPHLKHSPPNPFFNLPTHETHGPHIPLGAVIHTRPGHVGHIKQRATSSKPFISVPPNNIQLSSNKRNIKPIRVQSSTSNYRGDELFTASATSGAYSFLKKLPASNIKTRETVDVGLPGTSHYSFNPPQAHIEFNRFALPSTSESIFQQYNNPQIPAFIFGKHPQSNDVSFQFQSHNDEFTRNLVPPPQVYKTKNKEGISHKNVPENVVLQVPPFQFTRPKVEPVEVEVTKEKLNVFHNNIPSTINAQYVDYNFHDVRKPTELPKATYEVTEGQVWDLPPSRRPLSRKPSNTPKRRPDLNPEAPVFLPTPYQPETPSIAPTSPTQSEVSTIFSKLSQLQKEKELTTPDPNAFSTKEVSTHYPIFGKPIFNEVHTSQEMSNEITTQNQEDVVTTTEPPRIRPQRRRRPDHRRTTTTTTTEVPVESYDSQRTEENETERPVRVRRPTRYRTTTQRAESEEISTKTNRGRNRYRTRNNENVSYEPVRKRVRPARIETTTMPDKVEQYLVETSVVEEAASEQSEEVEDVSNNEQIEVELPGRHYITEPPKKIRYETIRPFIVISTTERAPTTNLVLPENEAEATDEPESVEEASTPTTTSTMATTTTSSHGRIKARPLKFDNSNRPRFSVKDYRQKLSQYSSTTSTEAPRTSSETTRIRLPGRLRRPTSTPSSEDEATEATRSRFVPKERRHDTEPIITEKNVKSINTRLRPFGRFKTTTAATTVTPKVSIKPNLFKRQRPPVLTLRSKIYNRYSKNGTESSTVSTTEESEVDEPTVDYEEAEVVSTTSKPEPTEENKEETTTEADIVRLDTNLYSQRVSDLTSSAKNDYNTFKSVSPNSRRIPNYFTISTEDPILPIEAFFPNIKDKMREKDATDN